ncbi:MAG TPA: hypothetical protein EYG73_12080 [Arcobacter sp.]|nr:hypothetical protein [Arcobacter sp.]
MVKFILVAISVILIGLVSYTYTGNINDTNIKTAVIENEISLSEKKPVEIRELKITKKETEVAKKKVKQATRVKVNDSSVLEADINTDLTKEEIMDRTILNNMNNAIERQSLPNQKEMLEIIIEDSKESTN